MYPVACDAVGKPAERHVRDDRQHDGNEQGLPRVYRPEDEYFIDHVEDDNHDEDFPYRVPTLAQPLLSMSRVRDNGPEIRRPPGLRISHSSDDRDDCDDSRLQEEAKRQRPPNRQTRSAHIRAKTSSTVLAFLFFRCRSFPSR